jgi:hypothetical protein
VRAAGRRGGAALRGRRVAAVLPGGELQHRPVGAGPRRVHAHAEGLESGLDGSMGWLVTAIDCLI